jgi:hypothetical protein
MKIAVVGAECSGKTTLAAGLAEALGVPLLPNPNPELLDGSGYHTLFEWGAATQAWEWWLERQADREQAFAAGVVDHGLIDHFCFVQRWAWNRLAPDRVERLRERVVAAAASYTHVLVTAPRLVAPPAPWRFRNAQATQQIDRLARALVHELGLDARACALPAADAPRLVQLGADFVRR